MSDYGITAADLRKRFTSKELAQLTTDPVAAAPDDAVIDDAVNSAEAELHLAAGVFYSTPIAAKAGSTAEEAASLLDGLKEKILDLAAYKLMQRRPQNLNLGERNLYWSQLKKSTDTWLERISTSTDRRIALPAAAERDEVVTSSGGAYAESDDNEFARDLMKGFI